MIPGNQSPGERNHMSSKSPGQALLTAFYEYLLITLPVGLFVTLDASHKQEPHFLWHSPEWAIATIFLLFQGLSLYVRLLSNSGAKVSPTSIGLLALVSLPITALTVINAYRALDEHGNTPGSIAIRLTLFGLVSAAFLLLVGGAKFYHLRKGGGPDA
jgi:hypothetical protein